MEEEKDQIPNENPSKIEYPLDLVSYDHVKCIEFKDWSFYFTNEKITHSKQLDLCQAYLRVQTIPEIFYG